MDGKAMENKLDDILHGEGDTRNFEITKEEAAKFKQAMGDPEFQSMLKDYMEEMQNPAVRAEQEKYITELENQNHVPEGKELIHPSPGFVMKTKFARNAEDDRREKLFINVVTSKKLAKPYSKPSKNRPGGEMWSMPVAVGQMRMEEDKSGDKTTTFDVCYHPEALVRAQHGSAFRDLVALSSLERVEDAFRIHESKITIDKNYRILKGIKYKSGSCAVMLASKADLNRPPDAARGDDDAKAKKIPPAVKARSGRICPACGTEVTEDAIFQERRMLKDASNSEKPPAAPSANEEDRAGVAHSKPAATARKTSGATARAAVAGAGTSTLPEGYKRGTAGTAYKLVESGFFEIADHTSERVREARVPQELIVFVKLPADAEPTRKLEVITTSRKLVVGVAGDPEGSTPRYLNLPLPYEAEDESKCSATRDKAGLLKITIPVKPPPVSPPSTAAMVAASAVDDGAKETLPEEKREHAVDTYKCKQPLSEATRQLDLGQHKPDHSRWVKDHEPGEGLDKPWEALARGEDKGTSPGDTTECIDSTLPPPPDVGQKLDEDLAIPTAHHKQNDLDIVRGVAEDAAFIGCAMFAGKVDGYEFKTDVQGCGYYRDDRDKKVPRMRWHETSQKMSGIADVPNVVDSTVRYAFRGNTMTLSFDARVGEDRGGGARIERYRTELILAGGVDAAKTEHNTADENVVIKLTKQPISEWGEHPTPTRVTRIGSAIDGLLGTMRAGEHPGEGETLGAKEDAREGLTGGSGADFEALAHEID